MIQIETRLVAWRPLSHWLESLDTVSCRPKKMCLELYADDVEFEINITQNENGTTPAITQAEINRIIQTAHKTAHTQPILNVNPA
jgi:hypothetical protein